MRYWFVGVAVAVLCSGCLETKEQLTILKDGSGTLAVTTVVPEGTVQFIDATLGAMMKAMQSMASSMATSVGATQNPEATAVPASVAEEIFANQKEIEKKAQKAGLKIAFKEFTKKYEGRDLHVQYLLTYDDINKLLASRIMGTKGELKKDEEGRLVFLLKSDPDKASQMRSQTDQMRQQCGLPGGAAATDPGAQKMAEAMKRFKIELLVTMPNELISVGGQFERQDKTTAYLGMSGDLLSDPALLNRLESMDTGPNQILCSMEGVTFEPRALPDVEEDEGMSSAASSSAPASPPKTSWSTGLALGAAVQARLKAGTVVRGKIVEENADSVQIETAGIPITYFKDEIDKVEADKT